MGTRPSTTDWVSRYYPELIAAVVTLFVLQTGLIPFDFAFHAPRGPAFSSTPVENPTLAWADIVGNIFLYVPVGFAFHWSLGRIIGRFSLAALLAIVCGALLSGGIETLQQYSPSRVSSAIDFVCNLLGTTVGSLTFAACHWIVPKAVAAAKTEWLNHPLASWLKAYVLLLFVFAAMPFSFSLNPNLIKRSVKSSHWVPCSSVLQDYAQADEALAGGQHRAYALARWSALKHWSRWLVEMLSFVPLVWLLHVWLVSVYRFNGASASALVWWYAGGLALLLSVAQLFVITRGFDVTDILARLLGVALGAWTIRAFPRHSYEDWMVQARALWRRLASAACVLSAGYILYNGVIPLTFDAPSTGTTSSLNIWPFFGYFGTRFDQMMSDIMQKTAAFAIFSLCFISASTALKTRPLSQRLSRACLASLVLAAIVETIQWFIPVRVTSLTDLVLAVAGCTVGVLVHDLIQTYCYETLDMARVDQSDRVAAQIAQRPMSLTDALIASLTDQSQYAPSENAPRTHPEKKGKVT